MEDEEEEIWMDEHASGDNTGVVCRGHRVNRRTRLSTDDKPENPALLFPSLLPFPTSLPFPSLLCRAGRKLAVAMCARRLQRLLTRKLSPHMQQQQQQQVDRIAAVAKIIAEP